MPYKDPAKHRKEINAANRKWKSKNKVKVKKDLYKYRLENKGKIRSISRKSYHKNKRKYKNRIKAYHHKYYIENKDRLRKQNHEYYLEHKDEAREYSKKYHLKNKYDLSIEEWTKLCNRQKGVCAICHRKTKLVIDHNHKTGKIRGILCIHCNMLLGIVEKLNIEIGGAVKRYLKRNS